MLQPEDRLNNHHLATKIGGHITKYDVGDIPLAKYIT